MNLLRFAMGLCPAIAVAVVAIEALVEGIAAALCPEPA